MNYIQRAIGFLVLALLVWVPRAMAQTPYSVDTRPSRGFMPSADQLSSPVDTVEPVSGKVHVDIPLASLPRGRANSGFDLNLVYDSHQYDVDPELLTNVPPEYLWMPPQYGYNIRNVASTGGWHYNIDNLKLEIEEHAGAVNDGPCPDEVPRLTYRVRLGLMDGSLHIMYLKGWESGDANLPLLQQGFAGLHPLTGTANHCAPQAGYPYQVNGWLTYYSIDGSYLKLETYVNSATPAQNAPFVVYFPDGRRMSGHGWLVDTIYDANGNAIHLTHGCNDEACNQIYKSISDDEGHEIRINFNLENAAYGGTFDASSDSITVQGPNGTMTTTVNWQIVTIGATPRTYTFSGVPWAYDQTRPLYLMQRDVKYVQLPMANAVPATQEPPVWNSYAFTYTGDPDGWGEINSLRTPSGMLVHYQWYEYGPDGGGTAPEGKVAVRTITHDGISDLVWQYVGSAGSAGTNTTVTNPDGSQTVYWYNPPANYLDSSIILNPYMGAVVYRIDEPNGHVQKRIWSQNRTQMLYTNTHLIIQNPWVRRETATIGNAAGTPSLTAVTDRMIDKNGNLLQTTEYDWVSYDPSGPETGSTPKRITQFTYNASVPDAVTNTYNAYEYWNPHFYPLAPGEARRLDAVARKEVSDGSGNKAAVTEMVYDDPFRAGNVTSELHWDSVKSASAPGLGGLSTANSQVLTRAYDGYGNVTDFYEPQIRTHISYDGTGSVPTRVDYAYGSAQQRSWVYSWNVTAGTLSSKTDLDNNISTTYSYDNAGRPTAVVEAGLRKTETIYNDANLLITVKKDLYNLGDGKLQVSTHYDQLGRSVLSRSSEPGNGDGIKVKSTYYPSLNRTVQSSPYRTLSDATLEWTCTQSDTSKRVTAIAIFKGGEPTDCASTTNRTGVTTTLYDSNQTTITDPASKQSTQIVDSLGRLMNAVEDPNGLYYITSYSYDTLGNLTQVDQGDQTRWFTYSSLGRLLLAHNPESGDLNYTYSDSGDLLTRSDLRGVVTTMTYDFMHRALTKSYSGDGGITPNVAYSYYDSGSSAPNIGQLQSMTSSAATVNYSYDTLGRMGTNSQTTNGNAYTFQYSYRLNDSISSMQYPSGKTVNYAVDDAGRVNQITAGSKMYADLTASSAPFTADGRIAQMKLGNDLWETRIFQTPGSPTLLMLGTNATTNANDKLELEFDYSPTANNGNLVTQIIRQPGHTWQQGYTYDALNRVATASETGGFSQTFGYDRYGNRWVASHSGISAYEPHEPTTGSLFNTANNRLANQSYDAAGNQLTYDPRTLAYDAENRMISAASSQNGNETYVYDGDGRRVRKTWTPNGGSAQVTTYVYGPTGQLAAEYSDQISASTGTSWMFSDLLGSVRAVTGERPQSGTALITECYDYLPFGRMLGSNDNGRNTGCYPTSPDSSLATVEAQKFTGKVRDAETGLDVFDARYYSGALGRWMIPDWSSKPAPLPYADFSNPQTFNLYGYVRNNPLNRTDPNGHEDSLLQQIGNSVFSLFKSYVPAWNFDQKPKQHEIEPLGLNGDKINRQAFDAQVKGSEITSMVIGIMDPTPLQVTSWAAPAIKGDVKGTMSAASIGLLGEGLGKGLAANKLKGDAFRDLIADLLRKAGLDVETEVSKMTPFGRRVIDIEVGQNGKVLGGIETKAGNSRYKASQRAKDAWLEQNSYPVDLVRDH